jgi:DNA-directed RNA polymerase specialized sigma subunit
LRDYENSTLRPDYSMRVIVNGLEAYTTMQEGRMPDGEHLGIQHGNDIPEAQAVAILKADIDRALRSLWHKERLVVICSHVMGFTFQEISYWLDCTTLDIAIIDDMAIRKMRRFLNNQG